MSCPSFFTVSPACWSHATSAAWTLSLEERRRPFLLSSWGSVGTSSPCRWPPSPPASLKVKRLCPSSEHVAVRCGQLDDAPHLVPHRSRLAGRLNRANVQGGELCSEVWLASRLVRHWHKEELAEEGVQTLDLPAAHVRAASKRAVTLLTCSPRKPAVKGDLRVRHQGGHIKGPGLTPAESALRTRRPPRPRPRRCGGASTQQHPHESRINTSLNP